MSKKITRKELITKKYNELQELLKQYITVEVFPSLNDVDVIDLIYFFSLTFNGGPQTDYRQHLKDIFYCRNLSFDDETFEKIYEIIQPYISWMKTLE